MRHRSPAGAQRTAATAALMLVLLAIAAAATGRGGSSGPPPGAAAVSAAGHHVLVVAVVVLVPILAVLGFVLMLYVQIMRKRERDPEQLRRRRNARRRALVALCIVGGLLVFRLRTGHNPLGFLHLHLQNPLNALSSSNGSPHLHRPQGGGGAISGTDWTLAVLVWALMVAAAVVVYLRVRGGRRELEPLILPSGEAEDGDLGLDAVRRERNPRRAVLAAYALMERLMARDGLARGPHEAPLEYLGRITLHGHHGAGSAHRLTALFQRARFGHRPVDEDMRQRAIAAVEELDAGTGGAA
jgi:uncharacterized protein DUF4129